MAGELSGNIAEQTGKLLGTLHRKPGSVKISPGQFDNTPLFQELRISPYLLTTAERHPELASIFETESAAPGANAAGAGPWRL